MPKPPPPRLVALLACAALLAHPADAQPPDPSAVPELVTDRPDQTESAAVVPPGWVQLESGWLRTESDSAGVETTVTELAGTLVRIGVSKRVELRLGWDGEIEAETRSRGARLTTDGAGDASLGFKVRLRDEGAGGRTPEMALLGAVVLPVGSDAFTSDRADPSLLLALANSLSERVSLGYNLGVRRESGPGPVGGTETETLFGYSAALGFALSPAVGLFTEIFGAVAGGSGAEDHQGADAGLTFRLRPNLQLDLAAGLDLGGGDGRFVLAGLSLRLPR